MVKPWPIEIDGLPFLIAWWFSMANRCIGMSPNRQPAVFGALMNIHWPPKFIFTRVQSRVWLFPIYGKIKKCSKTPTRYVFSSLKICICHHSPTGSTSSGASMMLGTYGSACVYFHHRQHWLVVSTCFNPFPYFSQFQSSSQILSNPKHV